MVLLDAIQYNVREESVVVKKAVYIAIGTDLEGKKDVLGLWVGATESSKYWLGVLNSLKNQGVQDILIMWVDGLTGFAEAIAVAYPQNEVLVLHYSPNQKLRPICILQGRKGFYCCAKAKIWVDWNIFGVLNIRIRP